MATIRSRFGGGLKQLTLFGGLGLLFAAGALLHPQFLTIANQRDVLAQVSINGVLAVGMTLVILSAGIDLSVGSIMSLCTVVCAMLVMQRQGTDFASVSRAQVLAFLGIGLFVTLAIDRVTSPWRAALGRSGRVVVGVFGLASAALAIGLAWRAGPDGFGTLSVLLIVPLVGGMMGLLNGLVIARTRLQPFIVTLGLMISAVGLAKFIAGHGGQIHPIYTGDAEHSGAPASFERLGATILTVGAETLRSGKVRPVKLIPVPGLFLLGLWALAAFVLHKLPLGRYIYAVGGNEETSRLSGVPVERVKVFVYTASGMLAGLAGVLYCAQYMQGKATAGQMKELDAIAAVVIGGTSLMGGRGSIVGTLVGVMIFGYLTNILQLRAVSSEIQEIVKGVIIVGAAAVQSGNVLGVARSLWTRRTASQE